MGDLGFDRDTGHCDPIASLKILSRGRYCGFGGLGFAQIRSTIAFL
jgi:hypothetical protein